MKTLIIAIVTLLLSLSTSWGQQPVILEALKNDPSYSGLLKEYLSLSAKEDDLELKLSDARALFAGGDTSENTKRTIVTCLL